MTMTDWRHHHFRRIVLPDVRRRTYDLERVEADICARGRRMLTTMGIVARTLNVALLFCEIERDGAACATEHIG